MKRILIFTAIAMLSVVGAKAQNITFGAKAGLNFASLSLKDDSSKTRTSLYVGGFAEKEFGQNLFGEVGLQYVGNGGKVGDATTKIHQINVPVTVKYEVFQDLRLKGGLYLGYIASMQDKYNGTTTTIDSDNYNAFDFGLGIGAEYLLPKNFFVELGYNLGLTDIVKGDGEAKNRFFQVGVGYRF